MINVNAFIFGRVYFPLRSNALKEIGKFIGATWTSPKASGLQSLVWRHHWDKTRSFNFQACFSLPARTIISENRSAFSRLGTVIGLICHRNVLENLP